MHLEKDIILLIESAASSFSKGQKKIAKYITNNYDKVAFMTASKLGKTVSVSESTVVRFAAELGFEGYPEMRKALQDKVRNSLTSVQRIEVSKSLLKNQDIPGSVLSADIEQIRTTMDNLDHSVFEKAVDSIAGADHVYILGLRSSATLSSLMGFYLNLLLENVKVVNESAASDVLEQMHRIGKNDVLVALGFPRYSKRTIRAIRFASDRKATVVGITDSINSPIAALADYPLYAKSEMVSFLDSLVAPMSLVNALIVAVSIKVQGSLSTNFEELERIWDKYEVFEKNNV